MLILASVINNNTVINNLNKAIIMSIKTQKLLNNISDLICSKIEQRYDLNEQRCDLNNEIKKINTDLKRLMEEESRLSEINYNNVINNSK